MSANRCTVEPWGRYSASGGLYYTLPSVSNNNSTVAPQQQQQQQYIYSFGGDTSSDQDDRGGGVVRTNFRYSLVTGCWERLADSPTEIGYRATATRLAGGGGGQNGDGDDYGGSVYVFGGADASYQATDRFWRYSLQRDDWTALEQHAAGGDRAPSARYKHATVRLSNSQMFVLGGRRGGSVLSDGWIFDLAGGGSGDGSGSWTLVGDDILQVYRHGMAYDTARNAVFIYGGLNGDFQRTPSQDLWQLRIDVAPTDNNTTININELGYELERIETSGDGPTGGLASHAVEYVAEWDALLVWGGTCGDDSELYVYNVSSKSWCRHFPANRPNRRDAMLWALDFPHFYVAQGDLICYNGAVYPVADVHVLDLMNAEKWDMIYEPYNQRGTGQEPYCDGNNAGNCQGQPLLDDASRRPLTCDNEWNRTSSDGSPTVVPEEEQDTTSAANRFHSSKLLFVNVSVLWLLVLLRYVGY